jgi:hypothetical protein
VLVTIIIYWAFSLTNSEDKIIFSIFTMAVALQSQIISGLQTLYNNSKCQLVAVVLAVKYYNCVEQDNKIRAEVNIYSMIIKI